MEIKMTKEFFDTLNIKDWSITGNFRRGGQANTVEVKNSQTGILGIFRTLHRNEPKDVERFNRELDIVLKNPHPNIITILEYSKDPKSQWYISKKGTTFETYWNNIYEKYVESDPDTLVEKAVSILGALNEGLIELHKKGVVHRDIKAKNIVICDNMPVLIDFGIAFVTGEERLTPINEAMANIYSPDPALNFMDEVPPWLDIFLLSQLLIWMISKGKNKPHAQRPLDWRWVIYPLFNEINLLKVKAITANCSNYFTAPKNATEFKSLLDSLFMEKTPQNQIEEELTRISRIIEKGKSHKIVDFSNNHEIIQSRLPLFTSFCVEFQQNLKIMLEKLKKVLPIEIENFEPIENFQDYFHKNSQSELSPIYQTIPISIRCGGSGAFFSNGFSCVMYTAKSLENSPQFKPFENIPLLAFTLNQSERLSRKSIPKSYYVAQRNGVTELLTADLTVIEAIDAVRLVDIVEKALTNEQAWEITFE